MPPFARHRAGFALFFAIFDVTRRCALETKSLSQAFLAQQERPEGGDADARALRRHAPRVVHALTLVAGGAIAGLTYELASRPWDAARKAVHVARVTPAPGGEQQLRPRSAVGVVLAKAREDGVRAFFRNPAHAPHEPPSTPRARRRLNAALRTLGRVGPWGVGFLVWEAFGPGLA